MSQETHTTNDEIMTVIGLHPVETTTLSFEQLGLSEKVLGFIKSVGFKNPTPIQSAVIPPALEGRDLIGLAQTGSGKTAAFVLPLAERLLHGHGIRGLILCPTREIALQTKAFLDLFGKHHRLKTVCLIGGVKMGPQVRDLQDKPDILVTTPGRLADHLDRKIIKLDQIQELVLDEADHMLDMGFMPQIEDILRQVPKVRHTMMFSATMPSSIERLAQRFLKDPVRIDVLPEGRAAEGITHRLYLVENHNKISCLQALLHLELGSTLIFTQMKVDADWVCRILDREKHIVGKIHSDCSQSERTSALKDFREGKLKVLIATGIASRGLDVPAIAHVINYDMPETVEEYIHRAGRTARGDAVGFVSTIATGMDKPIINAVETALGKKLPRCIAPGIEPYIEIESKPRRAKKRW